MEVDMVSTFEEVEEYLQEIERKPFGYGNKRPTAEDFQKMKEALRWTVEEVKNLQEKLDGESS